MKAIIELQKRAMDSSTDIVELVRYAYAIAYKLDSQDFVGWCNAELEGYFEYSNILVPQYRKGGIIKILCPDGTLMPLNCSKLEQETGMCLKFIGNTLSDLIKRIGQRDYCIELDLPLNFIKYYSEEYHSYRLPHIEMSIINGIIMRNKNFEDEMRLFVDRYEIDKILDSVRKKILDWALACEKQGILGEEWQFSPEEKAMAQNITYNINSVQNIANHNTESTINQTAQNMSVTKGDFQSLVNFLSDKGISEPDIQELKEIIEIEANITEDGVKNSKIQQWLGKIAVEANLVARGVEIGLLVEGIKCYFGF